MANQRDWYLADEPKPSLRKWIFTHMAMGAVYAAMVFFGVMLFILAIKALSALLPEDPYAMLDAGALALGAVV